MKNKNIVMDYQKWKQTVKSNEIFVYTHAHTDSQKHNALHAIAWKRAH